MNPQQQHAEMTHPKQRRSGTLWALRIFTVAAFAANMVVNYLGTLGYFGETNAEVSNKYPTLLTPAPWAFAIWALIFSLQGVYSIYGLLPGDDDKLQYVVLLNVFVPIGWIGEAVWTIIFNHELIPLSVLFITGSTFFFMTAYLRVTDPAHSLEIGGTAADLLSGRDPASDAPLLLKKAFYYLIFVAATALNFGWLVVASIVNGLIVLDYLRVDVPVAAAVGLLVFANAVAVLFLAWRREVVVSLVQVWAITAIAAKQTDPTLRAVCYGSVGVLAVLVGITLLAQTVSLVRDRSRQLHQASSGAYQMTDIFYSARHH